MEEIIKNAPKDVKPSDIEKATESGQQVMNGATDTVKTIGDYFGIDTAVIWFAALVAILAVWRIFRKLGKIALILIIISIIIVATAGTFIL